MGISNKYKQVRCLEIKVDREARQRREFTTEDLEPSIKRHGVLQPIIVTEDLWLRAGERRLATSIKLGLETIPVRFFSELEPLEGRIIELEENLRRKDLTWQENARAIADLHEAYLVMDKDWTRAQTAINLGMSNSWVDQSCQIARRLSDPRIAKAESWRTAINIIARDTERKVGNAVSEIMSAGSDVIARAIGRPSTPTPVGEPSQSPVPIQPAPPPIDPILVTDFIKWSREYEGPLFNFLHCDFPYGINVFSAKRGTRVGNEAYSDEKDVYWELCAALCENIDRILAPSAHVMFWFSMKRYTETMEFFRERAPSLAFQPFPLFWHKTDHRGEAPDAKRQPRRVYEVALIASREDRPLVKSMDNAYGAPTDGSLHPSCKPEPVLHHFFSMFVDAGTRMLDPTCGSGSSLRAAERLKAEVVLGLEIDPEHARNANTALRKARALRAASLRSA